MKKILQTVSSGGSGFGISFWKNWLGCQAKAMQLEELAAEARAKKTPAKLTEDKALLIGTIVHSYLELYYSLPGQRALKLNTTAVEFMDDTGNKLDVVADARLEAERIFRIYRARFPPNELGKVISVEEQLEGDAIDQAVHCRPFTSKPDLVVKIGQADIKRLKKTRRIDLKDLGPGYYAVDHKTGGDGEYADEAYTNETQFTSQLLGLQAKYPRRAFKGLLVNVLPKDKRPDFRTVVVPFPSSAKQQVLFSMLALAQRRRYEAYKADGRFAYPNVTHCFDYRKRCAFYDQCPRS